MNIINIEDIYVKQENGKRRTLGSLIEGRINQRFKANKLTEEEYSSLGGSKKKVEVSNEMVYKDPKYVFPNKVMCRVCKKKDGVAMTENKPGIECFVSRGSRLSYHVKTLCKVCGGPKNTFVSLQSLPPKAVTTINDYVKKNMS